MKINIYYGGRGLLEDPTLFALKLFQNVLEELRVDVERFNLYEQKNVLTTLPQTLKDADGIILATTVEWLGLGGSMYEFLDACWLYGDKAKISTLYMKPIVMSTTYGEREALVELSRAWETLGGMPCDGLSGYVDDLVIFEMNKEHTRYIEKQAENFYRTISQNIKGLPSSSQAVVGKVSRTQQLQLTPQESEQLSKYVSDDEYVRNQKEDLAELVGMFRNQIGVEDETVATAYIKDFESHFVAPTDFSATYSLKIDEGEKNLIIEVKSEELVCHYGDTNQVDQQIKVSKEILEEIIKGKMTFQRAFMTGEMVAKGDFKILRMLDRMFIF